ncbi:MAG: tRNA glutamyl-Q(34) synthetase GluQRS [Chromatiales bacterium]|nr:tRNA glutamyl-Q(34) synthetase GluQRS [Chromatiales bacterium]
MSTEQSPRGRFAPSPTGPLHFGSLVAALASWLDARSAGGAWLLRIEDLDAPRVVPGAEAAILRTLERFGLYWDGQIMRQSARADAYAAALDRLCGMGQLFACSCSRRELADSALPGLEGPVYPGTCRGRAPASGHALRVLAGEATIAFMDRIQGPVSHRLAGEIGDFVVRRGDGLAAYQLAVVVDDAAQGITDVVRGADLLVSTARQLHLQRLLGLPEPRYAHVPIALDDSGRKLSKQESAEALRDGDPAVLRRALEWLGQAAPPPDLGCPQILTWATARWDLERVPRHTTLPARSASD